MGELIILVVTVFCVTFLALGLHLVLHEVGHLIGGLLSGYDFVFFRIGSYTLLNDHGHLRFTKFNIPGTAGQCIMKPPHFDQFKYRLYFSGGILVNGMLALIGIFLCFCPIDSIRLFGIELVYMGIVFLLMNGLPLKMSGIVNDGYHIFKIKEHEVIKLYNQLMIGVLDIEGYTFSEMDASLFVCDMNNTSHFYDAYLILMNAMLLVEKQDYEAAREIFIRVIDDPHCIDLFKNAAKIMMVLLLFIEEGKDSSIEQYVDKKMMKVIKLQKFDLSSLLCHYCILVKEGNNKAIEVEKQFLKQKDNVLEQGEVSLFMDLYDKIKKHI